MLKFIVSNLYGDGNVYDSIMAYLNNVHKFFNDEIELYINGNLIDKGEDSARMLLDVYERNSKDLPIKIHYIAGQHELMMYEAFLERHSSGTWSSKSTWFCGHGGGDTIAKIEELMPLASQDKLGDFISNLCVYHKFDEKFNGKNIVVAHERGLEKVKDNTLSGYVNERDNMEIIKPREDNFIIEGYRPVKNKAGYEYQTNYNAINIDGGCKNYVCGDNSYDHVPLVEIDSENNRLIILTFNNNNEITFGDYFIGDRSIPMNNAELNTYRLFLDKNIKTKKLSFR